uniref:Uncharacterized protein n=1 Tax=Anguilla anguilla TaxID=7936 RepID=A0A0E9VKP7_ANGAN
MSVQVCFGCFFFCFTAWVNHCTPVSLPHLPVVLFWQCRWTQMQVWWVITGVVGN